MATSGGETFSWPELHSKMYICSNIEATFFHKKLEAVCWALASTNMQHFLTYLNVDNHENHDHSFRIIHYIRYKKSNIVHHLLIIQRTPRKKTKILFSSIALHAYWKCNFPMTPHGRLLVSWSVGWLVRSSVGLSTFPIGAISIAIYV